MNPKAEGGAHRIPQAVLPTWPPPSEAPRTTSEDRMALLGRLRGGAQCGGALGWQVRVQGGPGGGEGRATTPVLGQEGPKRAPRDLRLPHPGARDLDGSQETPSPGPGRDSVR